MVKIKRREEQKEQRGKTENCARKIICVAIVAGTCAHDYDNLRVRLFLNFTNAIGQLVARGLIKAWIAHKKETSLDLTSERRKIELALFGRYLDTRKRKATSL